MSVLTARAVNDRFVELLYMIGAEVYDPKTFVEGTWREDAYVSVLKMPKREMLSSTSAELAVELLAITAEPDWLEKNRRAMIRGDIFCFGGEYWAYIRTEHMALFTQEPKLTLTNVDGGNTSIVRLK